MLIHCLVDYDVRVYHLLGSNWSTDIARYFNLAPNTYLYYQYDLHIRRLWSKPGISEAPFCPRPAHEQAVKNFFDNMVGTSEKLMDYAKRGGINGDLASLLEYPARAEYRKASEAAERIFVEQRMAAETALNAASRPAFLDCQKKLLERYLERERALMENLKQLNGAAARNELWQARAATEAREEFCRQLSEEYGKFTAFLQQHQNPFFEGEAESFVQRVKRLDRQRCENLKKINEEYNKKIQMLTEELSRKSQEIVQSCNDDTKKLCGEANKIVAPASEMYHQTVKSARQTFHNTCIAAWAALFQKPENRIEIWRS